MVPALRARIIWTALGFTNGTTRQIYGQGTPQKDHYVYTAITISYTFFKLTCPE